MGWVSIKEYTERRGLSPSTVRRQIQEGRIFARKFGRNWYIHADEAAEELHQDGEGLPLGGYPVSTRASSQSSLQGLIDFSSKALHHYLLLSDRLVAEKEVRIKERDEQLKERNQEVAELEGYVNILEGELRRMKEKPEGWR